MNKFVDEIRAAIRVALWKRQGFKVVATNGCFDILHAGHVDFLEKARQCGHKLVVGLNTDESVKRLKGSDRPINTMADREAVLCGCEYVDLVTPIPETDVCQFLDIVRPDIWVKGGDYTLHTLNQDEVSVANAARIAIKILPFVNGHSTTRIIDKIKFQDDSDLFPPCERSPVVGSCS